MANNKGIQFEAIIAVVNTGFSEEVMAAAKSKGANGGTIVHCRGESSRMQERRYGVAITPEKEMLIIVVKKEIADDVMKAIYDISGPDKPGSGIVFSLPADHVTGIKFD